MLCKFGIADVGNDLSAGNIVALPDSERHDGAARPYPRRNGVGGLNSGKDRLFVRYYKRPHLIDHRRHGRGLWCRGGVVAEKSE